MDERTSEFGAQIISKDGNVTTKEMSMAVTPSNTSIAQSSDHIALENNKNENVTTEEASMTATSTQRSNHVVLEWMPLVACSQVDHDFLVSEIDEHEMDSSLFDIGESVIDAKMIEFHALMKDEVIFEEATHGACTSHSPTTGNNVEGKVIEQQEPLLVDHNSFAEEITIEGATNEVNPSCSPTIGSNVEGKTIEQQESPVLNQNPSMKEVTHEVRAKDEASPTIENKVEDKIIEKHEKPFVEEVILEGATNETSLSCSSTTRNNIERMTIEDQKLPVMIKDSYVVELNQNAIVEYKVPKSLKGWIIEYKPRIDPTRIDKFYIHLATYSKFRSLVEVEDFLYHGSHPKRPMKRTADQLLEGSNTIITVPTSSKKRSRRKIANWIFSEKGTTIYAGQLHKIYDIEFLATHLEDRLQSQESQEKMEEDPNKELVIIIEPNQPPRYGVRKNPLSPELLAQKKIVEKFLRESWENLMKMGEEKKVDKMPTTEVKEGKNKRRKTQEPPNEKSNASANQD